MICLEISDDKRWEILREYLAVIHTRDSLRKRLSGTAEHECESLKRFINQDVSSWKKWCEKWKFGGASEYAKKMERVFFPNPIDMWSVLLGADYETMLAVIFWMNRRKVARQRQHICRAKVSEGIVRTNKFRVPRYPISIRIANIYYLTHRRKSRTQKRQNGNPKTQERAKGSKKTNARHLIENVLDYSTFRKRPKFQELFAHFFNDILQVSVCPYCNRNWITSIPGKARTENTKLPAYGTATKKKETPPIITAQMDHYFPQAVHPYLALSIFNLVPCCPICNNRKLDRDVVGKHWKWYPYERKYCGNVHFSLNLNKVRFGSLSSLALADIKDLSKENALLRIESSKKDPVETLKLQQLYYSHAPEVQEIVFRALEYSRPYWELNSKLFPGDYVKTFSEDQKLRRELLLQEESWEEQTRRNPLGKMKHDVAEELLLQQETEDEGSC